MTSACSDLFFKDKDPNDDIMCDYFYTILVKAHPEEVSKIEKNTAGGWNKFWREALQSLVILIIQA